MNSPQAHPQSREFREVTQEDEYDPFGETIYHIGDKRHESCHLEEAIQNMTDDVMAQYKSKCKTYEKFARVAPDSIFADQAAIACHKFLMKWAKQYWAEAEKRIEGEKADAEAVSENVYEDGYCR